MSIRSLRRRRRRTLLRPIAVLGLGAAGTAVWPQAPAANAYYTEPDWSCLTSFSFLPVGTNWSNHSADYASGGRRWNFIQQPEGGPWVDAIDGGPPAVVEGYREELGGNKVGRANCLTLKTWLDVDVDPGNQTESTGLHEFGHLIGLEHTGDADSIGQAGTPPAMSTCRGFTTPAFGQDDHAQLGHMRDDFFSSNDVVNADVSFETGGLSWWSTSGLAITRVSGNALEGDHFLELQAEANHTTFSMFQTTRNTDPHVSYTTQVGYKDGNSGTTGYLGQRLSSRQVSYAYDDPDDCGYFSDFDLNRPSVGTMTYRTAYSVCPTHDGWVYCQHHLTWTTPTSWDAADIRINVYKDTNGPLWIDGVRIRGNN